VRGTVIDDGTIGMAGMFKSLPLTPASRFIWSLLEQLASPSIDRAILITPLSHVYGAAHWPFWRRAERISNAVAGADLLHVKCRSPFGFTLSCTLRLGFRSPISLGIHCIG